MGGLGISGRQSYQKEQVEQLEFATSEYDFTWDTEIKENVDNKVKPTGERKWKLANHQDVRRLDDAMTKLVTQ